MTKRQLLTALRRHRKQWHKVALAICALQDIGDVLIDEIDAHFSDAEWREYKSHLDAVWKKSKNRDLAYTAAMLNQAIAILEKTK